MAILTQVSILGTAQGYGGVGRVAMQRITSMGRVQGHDGFLAGGSCSEYGARPLGIGKVWRRGFPSAR